MLCFGLCIVYKKGKNVPFVSPSFACCLCATMLCSCLTIMIIIKKRECEEANQAANQALEAKREGDLQGALDAHAQAARQFREAAVLIKDRNGKLIS